MECLCDGDSLIVASMLLITLLGAFISNRVERIKSNDNHDKNGRSDGQQ